MPDPIFGISINRVDNEPRIPVYSDLSVVGIIGTAPAANADTFPLDAPITFFSTDAAKLLALGADGTIPQAIALINSQLGDFQAAARIVVVRVEPGTDEDEDDAEAQTIANIVGDGIATGLSAFLRSGPDNGVIPRLIVAPGYTHQRETGVASLTIANAGTGYTAGTFNLTASGGGGSGFAGTATVVGGLITAVNITNPGSGYTSNPTISLAGLTGGSGGSVTAVVEQLANAVCAALPPILSRLLAHAVVSGPMTSALAAQNWRETMASDRLIPIFTRARVMDGTEVVTVDAAPAVVGVAVRRDFEKGGLPFWSWANQPLQGIVGVTPASGFSLTDGATEGQDLLGSNIGIIVRGEMGVESAVSSSGFVFIGTDNAGTDDLWRFYNVTRGRDYIHLSLLRTVRDFLGFNITSHTIQAIQNTVGGILDGLKADGAILGYRVSFNPDQNTPEDLRAGRFTIMFEAEEAPVLRHIKFQSARYRPALEALVSDLMAQAGTITG